MNKEYFLDRDNEGHWYIIPSDKEKEWNKWFSSEDYNDGIIPNYVIEVGGSHTLVRFKCPRIN